VIQSDQTVRAGAGRSVRTAVIWRGLQAELDRRAADGPLRVLDVGGGSGGFAVPLACQGHVVSVVDPSPNALATLSRRAADAGVASRVQAVQGDLASLVGVVGAEAADLVLCHSVLEYVDDPAAAVHAIRTVLRPAGLASVVLANRAAAVLARAIGGHFGQAAAGLRDADGQFPGGDTALRRYDPVSAAALLTGAGLTVEQVHGVRVVADLVDGAVDIEHPTDDLLSLELALSDQPPYRDIATQLHLLARNG
jgi:SAM-dependent methyltransferase